MHEVLPRAEVKGIEDVTEEVVTRTLRRATSFLSNLQSHDGHWPGDYGGPMFMIPSLVSFMPYQIHNKFFKRKKVKLFFIR